MRISRSVSFRLKLVSKKSVFIVATSMFTFASVVVSITILQPVRQVKAAVTPEACFTTTPPVGNEVRVAKYTIGGPDNCPTDVVVPDTIGGNTVTSVGVLYPGSGLSGETFSGVTSLTLPSTLRSLGYLGALNVTKLVIPKSVERIEACSTHAIGADIMCSEGTLMERPLLSSQQPYDLIFELDGLIADIPPSAFAYSNMKSLQLPPSIRQIGTSAFEGNGLTSLILPNGLVGVGTSAFFANELTSVSLPNSLRAINTYAFASNRLKSVSLPAGIEYGVFDADTDWDGAAPESYVSIKAFVAQSENKWAYATKQRVELDTGTAADCVSMSDNPAYSAVPESGKSNKQLCNDFFLTKFWYTKLYVQPPTDVSTIPNYVDYYSFPAENGNMGGQIINPASVTIRYVDASGRAVRADSVVVGEKNNTPIGDYLVDSGPIVPFAEYMEYTVPEWGGGSTYIYDPSSQKTALDSYFRVSQSRAFTAPAISGYVTPAAQTKTLAAGDNTITFVYQPESTATPVISVPFNQHAVSGGSLTPSTTPASIAAHLIKSSSLAIANTDDSAPTDCSTIQSANLLAPNTLTTPPPTTPGATPITILGGLDFTLTCTPGAETKVHYSLGSVVSDIAKLRIYKHSAKANKTEDITSKTTVTNLDGKTVISYSLIDGGTMDEDGQVNGQIVDPIYVGLENTASELANTGTSLIILALAGISLLSGSSALLIYSTRRVRRAREVS